MPTRRAPSLAIVASPYQPQRRLSPRELAAAAGISERWLARLVRLGVVEPEANGFPAITALRLHRMARLHRDLGVTFLGAAIAVDLIERIERLERELARVRGSR
jgi:hypothetical protein